MKTISVPYICTNTTTCPGRHVHDCGQLAEIQLAVDELEPDRDDQVHMTCVLLTAMIAMNRERDDLAMALAAFSGYSLSFVRVVVERVRRLDIFAGNKVPADWLEHPIALLTDAMAVIGILERRVENGDVGYIVVEHKAPPLPWDRRSSRCQIAVREGWQCIENALPNSICCEQHRPDVIVFQRPIGRPAIRRAEIARLSGLPEMDLVSITDRYRAAKNIGICVDCERVPSLPSKARCEACLVLRRKSTIGKAARRRALGQCAQCGADGAAVWRCSRCKEKRKKKNLQSSASSS